MRITEINLRNFKYFDNVKLEIPPGTDVVVLLGPNGVGKSCVFDAFNFVISRSKDGGMYPDESSYYLKQSVEKEGSSKKLDISITLENGSKITPDSRQEFKRIYGRSAYRFTPQINRHQMGNDVARKINKDGDRAHKSIDHDDRLENDVEYALGERLKLVQDESKIITNADIREKITKPAADSLNRVLNNDLQFERLLDPVSSTTGKLDVLFSKAHGNFPYQVLSAGEKEIFNILFNFHCRKEKWIREGIYFLDEPELHLNTSIQKNLFEEMTRLCREVNAQCWIASHSIGFMRAAQDAIAKGENIAVLKFEEQWGTGEHTITSKKLNRKDWADIFKTALDDLSELISPKIIIYCEGDSGVNDNNEEQGLDAECYNAIFNESYPAALFVSAGGGNEPRKNSEVAVGILSKAFLGVEVWVLKDRGGKETIKTAENRMDYLGKNKGNRMLIRREIENYLYDHAVLKSYKPEIDLSFFTANVHADCLKAYHQSITCAATGVKSPDKGKIRELKLELAKHVKNCQEVYNELEEVIFGEQYNDGKA